MNRATEIALETRIAGLEALLTDAQSEIADLKRLLSAYVADETRFNRGEGEPYGSIATETGMRARAAIKR